MTGRGYSLVEMVVIICIISILLAIATLRFNDYATRNGTESQTRTIYVTLLNTQANAVYQRKGCRVKLYPKSFEVYSSLTDGVSPIASHTLSYPIIWNNTNSNNIDFNNKGMPNETTQRSVCVESGDGSGAVDSVVIGSTRVSIGKRKAGELCNADNITKR